MFVVIFTVAEKVLSHGIFGFHGFFFVAEWVGISYNEVEGTSGFGAGSVEF